MATTKPEGPAAPFQTYLVEDQLAVGVGGLPNFWRNGENGEMVPVDPQREQSGGLSDAPSVAPVAAPGNAKPAKY